MSRTTRYAITNVERTGYLLPLEEGLPPQFTINVDGALTFDSATEASLFMIENQNRLPDDLTWAPV
jgi:hypothetical protein